MLTAQEDLDDAHGASATWAGMVGRCWLLGLDVGCFDGIDWNEADCEQCADACNILGAGLAGEETVVADAVEALRQDVHQEAADELVCIEHHLLVALGPSRR